MDDAHRFGARWRAAQDYERSHWREVARRVASGAQNQLTWYRRNAAACEALLRPHLGGDPESVGLVVEVGSGPVGISAFLSFGRRVAVDPLADEFAKYEELVRFRPREVLYVAGEGEHLPFRDAEADVVVCENVLDHTCRPDLVLREIRRVMRPSAALYFKVNVRTAIGTCVHRLLSLLRIDRGHPHSYSRDSIRRTLSQHGFDVRAELVDDAGAARRADFASARLKDRAKAVLGVSEFWYSAVCRKRA